MQLTFLATCRAQKLPEPTAEHRFHPERRWRFDYAFVERKIAVEVEGGIYTRGRHVRPKGFIGDMSKYNEAQSLGWKVLRFSPQQIADGSAARFIRDHWPELANDPIETGG